MTKYLLNRLLRGLFSVFVVVVIVMILVYTLMNRDLIFVKNGVFTKQNNNQRINYKYSQWEKYGYLDYVTYTDYLNMLLSNGEITAEEKAGVVSIGRTPEKDSDSVAHYVQTFTEYYEALGYKIERLDAVMLTKTKVADGGQPLLYASKDKSIFSRIGSFFGNLITIDNIHDVKDDLETKRGLTFTFFDPVYNTENGTGKLTTKVFSPAIIGNGTRHKYLLYFDNQFPFIHQNLVTIKLGTSYSVNQNVDVFDTMTQSQGPYIKSMITFPTGLTEESAYDLHSATYASAGTKDSLSLYSDRYVDDYCNLNSDKRNNSKLGYSFVIGLIASIVAYLFGIPLGIVMARKKDKLIDKFGTFYIVFILAVPSLAYIFMFKAIGASMGLPYMFEMDGETWLMYILPIVSLALPSIAGLMKWIRRYMIDQMNSDYVKFARSGGLTEKEIFSKHILKNAAIPIIHGIPGSVLGALVGAIITERVYLVPGAGNLLTTAINSYDNSVIVGLTLFYALISVISIILGDMLMAMVDPRISFSEKPR